MVAQQLKRVAPDWAKEASRPAFRRFGLATASTRPLPDFLIIGTKRGGTTSLFKYLNRHPNVLPMWPGVENAKKTFYFDDNWDRGERWYRSHFATRGQRDSVLQATGAPAVTGEAAPYYMFHPLVLDRVQQTIPNVRCIVLLRNPVDRIWSHFHERSQHTETLSFAEALAAEDARLAGEAERIRSQPGYRSDRHDYCSYKARGRYLEHLEPWLNAFGPDQLLVVRSEDMYRDPQATVVNVQRFLGVPVQPPETPHRFNYVPARTMDEDLRAELADYYAPHVSALEERLGRRFNWDLLHGGLLGDELTTDAAAG